MGRDARRWRITGRSWARNGAAEQPPFNLTRDVVEALDRRREALRFVDAQGVIDRRTFGDVAGAAAQWSSLLGTRGLVPGDRVAVLVGPTAIWPSVILGALKAGLVAVPVPAAIENDELEIRLRDTDIRLVVADRDRAMALAGLDPGIALVVCEDVAHELRALEAVHPTHETTIDDPALILMPDGEPETTLTHGGIRDGLGDQESLGLGPDDLVWCAADPGSATWLLDGLLAPWAAGVAIVIHGAGFDPLQRLDLVQRLGVTVLSQASEEYRQLVEHPIENGELDGLRRAVSLGGSVDPEVAEAFRTVTGLTIEANEQAPALAAAAASRAAETERIEADRREEERRAATRREAELRAAAEREAEARAAAEQRAAAERAAEEQREAERQAALQRKAEREETERARIAAEAKANADERERKEQEKHAAAEAELAARRDEEARRAAAAQAKADERERARESAAAAAAAERAAAEARRAAEAQAKADERERKQQEKQAAAEAKLAAQRAEEERRIAEERAKAEARERARHDAEAAAAAQRAATEARRAAEAQAKAEERERRQREKEAAAQARRDEEERRAAERRAEADRRAAAETERRRLAEGAREDEERRRRQEREERPEPATVAATNGSHDRDPEEGPNEALTERLRAYTHHADAAVSDPPPQ